MPLPSELARSAAGGHDGVSRGRTDDKASECHVSPWDVPGAEDTVGKLSGVN